MSYVLLLVLMGLVVSYWSTTELSLWPLLLLLGSSALLVIGRRERIHETLG